MTLPAQRVIRVLEQLDESRSLPAMIRVDNGLSSSATSWMRGSKSAARRSAYIQPGSPTQNAYIERLNGSLRRELLDAYVYRTLDEVWQPTEAWQHDYNPTVRTNHWATGHRSRPP